MSLLRLVTGWVCIAIALVLIAFAALGGFGGLPTVSSPALMAHLPGVVFGLVLLAVGAWLVKGRASR